MSFNVGDPVGDYQVIGVLGAGGMGKVYKVRNTISDRVEAMKVLLPNPAAEPELADRFIREIKLVASLDHSNIASLHTALRLENQLLMFMEFVEGETLEERLKRGPLAVGEAVECIDQVLAALQYAHGRGIIHRDIKPANMMLTQSGAIKLMDFGIAKASADRRLTATGTTMGSLYYMSPEQIKGSVAVDARTDLYSVGVSLYELVTGQRPFRGDSDYSIMVAHLEQEPVPPIQIDPRLPQVLSDLILTAIQKEPARRFQTAQAFRAALKSLKAVPAVPFEAAAPVTPSPMPLPPAKPASRRGLYMALGALAAVVVLAVAVTQLPRWQKTRASETTAPVTQQALPAAQPPAQAPQEAQPPPAQPPPAATESKPAPRPPRTQPQEPAKPAGRTTPPPAETTPPPAAAERAQPAPEPARETPAQPSVSPELREAFRKEFMQVREHAISLAARANALRASLQNLEEQQRRSGLSMRTDIATSWKRMEAFLDEAEAALKDRDLPGAKRALALAEREADRLDRFLGR